MITLGLDPSLTGFGWCVHDSSKLGSERIVQSAVIKTTPQTLWVKRYMDLRDAVSEILDRFQIIEAVGMESPTYGEQWSEGSYALFVMINEAVWTHRRDVVYFDPGTVKMLAKGDHRARKGPMFKADMVEAVRAETGATLNHNAADAYLVARSAARFWMLVKGAIQEADLLPAERQAFVKVHTFVRGKRAGQTDKQGAIFKEGQRYFRFSQYPESHE